MHSLIPQQSFKIPTQQEVINQFELKGITDKLEAEKFFHYYTSNGWYVGKGKMKSWKAAVSGWVLRSNAYNSTNNNDKFSESSIRSRMAKW